jgi:hypothetical protein
MTFEHVFAEYRFARTSANRGALAPAADRFRLI